MIDMGKATRQMVVDTRQWKRCTFQARPIVGTPSTGVVSIKSAIDPDGELVALASGGTLTADGSALDPIDTTDIAYIVLEVTTAESGVVIGVESSRSGRMDGDVVQWRSVPIDDAVQVGTLDVSDSYKAVFQVVPHGATGSAVVQIKRSVSLGFPAIDNSPADQLTLSPGSTVSVDVQDVGAIYPTVTTAGSSGQVVDILAYHRAEVAEDAGGGGGGATTLAGLTDVTIASAADGQRLEHDGTDWKNQAHAGTLFPSSPYDGQPFYRTDLDMPELFRYDSTRGKWLGELRAYQFGRNSSASSGSFDLRFAGGVQLNTSRGLLTPVALTIVGAEFFNGTGISSGSADLDFYEGSTNLTTLLTINARGEHDHTLNYDLDADSGWPHKYPRFNSISGLTLNNPTVVIYMRRRET